jgi:hypothetical protein
LVVLVCLCALGVAVGGPAGAWAQGGPVTVADPRITESSGLAASVRHPGVLYTHNDSGDSARMFALAPDGRVLATLRFAGVQARDWEAVAMGRDDAGRPAIFAGDIGDNLGGAWPFVSVFRVTEPATLGDATLPATRFRLRYADGPRDAEALLIDPRSGRLYVASKQASGAGLYQAPAVLRSDRDNLLRRVAGAPPWITDGAFAPDGRTFVLRDYLAAHVYRAPGRLLASFPLPPQLRGESITYTPDGRALLVGSEGVASQIWRVPLPAAALPAGAAPPPAAAAPAATATAGGELPAAPPRPRRWALLALLPVALVGGARLAVEVVRRRRRRPSAVAVSQPREPAGQSPRR